MIPQRPQRARAAPSGLDDELTETHESDEWVAIEGLLSHLLPRVGQDPRAQWL